MELLKRPKSMPTMTGTCTSRASMIWKTWQHANARLLINLALLECDTVVTRWPCELVHGSLVRPDLVPVRAQLGPGIRSLRWGRGGVAELLDGEREQAAGARRVCPRWRSDDDGPRADPARARVFKSVSRALPNPSQSKGGKEN